MENKNKFKKLQLETLYSSCISNERAIRENFYKEVETLFLYYFYDNKIDNLILSRPDNDPIFSISYKNKKEEGLCILKFNILFESYFTIYFSVKDCIYYEIKNFTLDEFLEIIYYYSKNESCMRNLTDCICRTFNESSDLIKKNNKQKEMFYLNNLSDYINKIIKEETSISIEIKDKDLSNNKYSKLICVKKSDNTFSSEDIIEVKYYSDGYEFIIRNEKVKESDLHVFFKKLISCIFEIYCGHKPPFY